MRRGFWRRPCSEETPRLTSRTFVCVCVGICVHTPFIFKGPEFVFGCGFSLSLWLFEEALREPGLAATEVSAAGRCCWLAISWPPWQPSPKCRATRTSIQYALMGTYLWAGCSRCTRGGTTAKPAESWRRRRGSTGWRPCYLPWIVSIMTTSCCLISPSGPVSWTPAPGTPMLWNSRWHLSRRWLRKTQPMSSVSAVGRPSSLSQREWWEWLVRLPAPCQSW